MTPTGRLARNVAAVLLAAGLIAGTVWWQTDDTWPLAQMRMFPGGEESDVTYVRLRAELEDGSEVVLGFHNFHLRRAEVEGQLGRIRREPAMLGDLAELYNRGRRDDEQIVRMILLRRYGIRSGSDFRWYESELVRWPA